MVLINHHLQISLRPRTPMIKQEFLRHAFDRFEHLREQGRKSMDQIHLDSNLFWTPDSQSNSVAIIVKHLTGNMRSRWTNIFDTDGEKPDRNRPSEFDVHYKPSREELMKLWDQGWNYLFTTLNSLQTSDLMQEIKIRKEPHTVLQAIMRQLSHYAVHVGQITYLSKQIEHQNWDSLSIPREQEVFDYREL